MPTILGIAGSLRNARWGAGNEELVKELQACATESQLRDFLSSQADLHLENFLDAGRARGLAFTEIHKNLRKLSGQMGLSNSEIALAAGLWAASAVGCEIRHISLSEFFPAAGVARNLDELKAALRSADGILVSAPVYFGDRGSLVQDFVDMIRDDLELQTDIENKVYGGIAVGAKRNGGQETTLIYQLMDMVGLGFLGVGNDSETTAQYGGTGHAGDVGTMAKDDYGIATSLGVGRRIGHIVGLLQAGKSSKLRDKIKVLFWVLQDRDNVALQYVQQMCEQFDSQVMPTIVDVTERYIARCIACDICPTHVDTDLEYRCIIHGGNRDQMGALHDLFLGHDAIIPVVHSPADRKGMISNYQRFIERTRYLRRGDYVFSDCLTAPLVIEDIGVLHNMHIRMTTSLIRHHTVTAEPMMAHMYEGRILNPHQIDKQMTRFVSKANHLACGRLQSFVNSTLNKATAYKPVGYILSTEKDKEDEKLNRRQAMVAERHKRLAADAAARLDGLQKLPSTPVAYS